MRIPDPMEIMESKIERLVDMDENTCMSCGVTDEELVCMSPTGDGPLFCAECAGLRE